MNSHVIGASLLSCLSLAPQIIPSNTEAVVIGDSTAHGVLRLAALALGDGGIRTDSAGAVRRLAGRDPAARGRGRTPGGVLVRAKSVGARLDFPNGRQLMVTPDGRVHLRSGEVTLPFFRGVEIFLADGSRVTIRRGANPRLPLASVEVVNGKAVRRLWSGTRQVVNASRTGRFVGTTLLALGDGGCLYAASSAGPLVALERVLCPRELHAKFPLRRLVVVGDVLARSLQKLPAHAPPKSVQFPQVQEAALRFARLGYLFAGKTPRPPGAVGHIWFALPDRYRLNVAASDSGAIVLGLYREGSGVPGVEWTVAGRTQIRFVRPDGGANGGPRYFLRGIDLDELVRDLLPIPPSIAHTRRVRRVIAGLGGKESKKLDVRHRSRVGGRPTPAGR